ncbi:hypothetical protein F5Y15DRAFT_93254 [Xylariaceae sp. FL0016]|nr:hypothetical protein F5Y15DRAFT_93254 [Xylariaceae sp. FL0016]
MSNVEDDRGPQLRAVNLTFLAVSIITTVLRSYTRGSLLKAFGRDDWTMLVANVSFAAFVGCSLVDIDSGLGRHQKTLTSDQVALTRKFWWLCYIWYDLAIVLARFSIGFYLLRITPRRYERYALFALMLWNAVVGIVFFGVTVFQCTPVSHFWDKSNKGHCIEPGMVATLFYLYSAMAVIIDASFAIVPVWMMKGLQVNRRTKMLAVPILGLGSLTSVAVIVRIAFIYGLNDPDFTWSVTGIAVWTITEPGLAITSGNLATLQPLLRAIFSRIGLWSSSAIPHTSESAIPPPIPQGTTSKESKPVEAFELATLSREQQTGSSDGERENSAVERASNGSREWTTSFGLSNESQEELRTAYLAGRRHP